MARHLCDTLPPKLQPQSNHEKDPTNSNSAAFYTHTLDHYSLEVPSSRKKNKAEFENRHRLEKTMETEPLNALENPG